MEETKPLHKKLTLPMMTGQHSKTKPEEERVMKKYLVLIKFLSDFLSHVKVSNKSNDHYVTKSNNAKFGPWSVTDSRSKQTTSKSLADIAGDWMERLRK